MARLPETRVAAPSLATEPTGQSRPAELTELTDIAELTELRAQLREAQETIEAIRSGGIDSLMIGPPGQEQVYSLASADRPYRLIVETMNEGAATVSPRGVILNVNPRLVEMTGRTASELVSRAVLELVPQAGRAAFAALIDVGAGGARGEVDLIAADGATIPVLLAVSGFDLDGLFLRCLVLTDLTAQRAAERQAAAEHAALREQDAFLEQAQKSVGLGWCVYTPGQGDLLTLSPEACRIFGLDPAEFDGKLPTLLSRFHPDDLPMVTAAISTALAGGPPYHVEHRVVWPDGSLRWVMEAAVVAYDDAGAVKQLLGVCQDLTEQRRTEDEIRATAAYNRSLIEAGLDPLVTIGPDGKITDANPATERATGYDRAELIGTEFSDYFTEPARARAGYEQVFRDGSARDYPLELRHRDGPTISVLYNASVYRDPDGQVLGVIATARDVTQANRTQAELRQSEARFRSMFESAPIAMAEATLDGRLLRVNARICQLTGYTAAELLAMPFQHLTHPDDRAADAVVTGRLAAGDVDTYTAEKRYVRKDGKILCVEVTRSLMPSPGGELRLTMGVVRDLTAEHEAKAEVTALHAELEARVKQRTADLEQSNQNLQAFTYSVAHDLRTPLRGLSGFSEALLDDYGDRLDETGRGYGRRIQAASERMGTIIDDLLRLSGVTHAGMDLRPIELGPEVAAIAARLQADEPGRRVSFAIEDGIRVVADRDLIRSVLRDLVENAWKFTAGRDHAVIEFASLPAADAKVCCYVRDNGAGFDATYVDKLFQPFQRLHTTEYGGAGIGLASVRRIVERHGGRTWAEGAVGAGATFYFTLDAAPPGPP
jgi:PAS domain S-box-containing protein